jgi:hypothetical protein
MGVRVAGGVPNGVAVCIALGVADLSASAALASE